ncbi:MAG TPA: helix-turn-helix domain-containing protein [Ktedonobacteraceae bacterium]|nr:helix-turn-helix domain-containing protein [Ktedonobacteraceae bacterium]
MDIPTYLTPWSIGGAVAGLVFSVAAIISLVTNRRHVGAALKQIVSSLFSQIGFFSIVIIVFMVISVLESGSFFDANITHHAILGLLGYALALGFDLVSVVCMLARLNAQRMRDEHGSRLNLVGVMICAAVSAFANAAGSLQGYNPADLNRTPIWMQISAPWLGMVFPALIVVLSMTTDHILDHAPSRGIDVPTFRERERKRVDMLQVRLDTERELLKLETELSTLRHKRELASGHMPREWVFWRWLRPVVPAQSAPTGDERKAEIDQAVQTLRSVLEERLEKLGTHLSTQEQQLKAWTGDVSRRMGHLDTHIVQLHERVHTLRSTKAVPIGHNGQKKQGMPTGQGKQMDQWTPMGNGYMRTSENQQANATGERGIEGQRNTAEAILAAFLRLGANTPDTRIAREMGCSRRTVARYKKRFLELRLLTAEEKSEQPQYPFQENEAEKQGGGEEPDLGVKCARLT